MGESGRDTGWALRSGEKHPEVPPVLLRNGFNSSDRRGAHQGKVTGALAEPNSADKSRTYNDKS